jgi:Tol biopolymer transport system component/DNA-binding winged helix-turn-helix (wHTH) protein
MGEVPGSPRLIRFGTFEVDLRAKELRKNGVKIKLQEQPFQILAMLLERPGEVVTREELENRLWSADTFVDFEHSLATAVKKLREALGDSADNPRFIETLPKRGYRFIAPVEPVAPVSPPAVAVSGRGALGAPAGGPSPPLQKRRMAAGLVSAAIVGTAVVVYWLSRPLPPPRVLRSVQLTNSGRAVPVSNLVEVLPPMLTDGSRIYFEAEGWGLAQVSAAGGEPYPLPTPADIPWPLLDDISPDGSTLLLTQVPQLLRTQLPNLGMESPMWILPTLGGATRRVGDILAHAACWSPSGQQIAYANGSDLFVAESDGSHSRKLVSLPGRAYWPRFSPEASRLRFTLRDSQTNALTLWEVNADGAHLHALLPGWNIPPEECCGNWTSDGKYFVFQSARGGMTNVWAMRENGRFLRGAPQAPVQLTSGPLSYHVPVPSKDGKRLFVVGMQPRDELVRYDAKSRRFVPYLTHITPAGVVAFSRDGDWVTYIKPPEGTLWRSRADGSQRLQLTSPPMEAMYPRWSPDGTHIAFPGKLPGQPWKIYVVNADGGHPQQLSLGNRNVTDPDWSPDGNQLVFGRMPDYVAEASVPKAIHVLDLRTKQVSQIPGSDDLFSPDWSPDGRYILAITLDHRKLMLFDFETRRWTQLAEQVVLHQIWSRDGSLIYFQSKDGVYRVRISDRKIERIVGWEEFQRPNVLSLGFVWLAPDDSPLLVVEQGIADIYALEWEAP